MRIFLIHDELREDRKKLFEKELELQGIPDVEIVPAVKTDMNIQKNISEAHKSCIRRALEENLDQVMVLEDDVKFSAPGAYNEFLRLFKELPEDWDIYTGGSYDYKVSRTPDHGTHLIQPLAKLRTFSGLHCYMVNKKFYQSFLETRGISNLDKALIGNIYICNPMIAVQWDTYSANRRQVTNYNTVFANKIKLWKGKDSEN